MLTEEKIKELLRDRNLRQVSRETGISHNRIFYWMSSGGKPAHDLIVGLSNYLEENARKTLEGL